MPWRGDTGIKDKIYSKLLCLMLAASLHTVLHSNGSGGCSMCSSLHKHQWAQSPAVPYTDDGEIWPKLKREWSELRPFGLHDNVLNLNDIASVSLVWALKDVSCSLLSTRRKAMSCMTLTGRQDSLSASRFIPTLNYYFKMQGLALFLLLAFRTNSSYDRWWEGRKLWDAINTKVQDMTRMAMGECKPQQNPPL